MSHGPAADSTVEPNLTPLLDLVLQLLMFFMITVNFTQGVTNTGETLPHSQTVAPLDADGTDPIILSVKPFRMTSSRDDFKYFGEKERDRLKARFKQNETCVMIPTEQLTSAEKDRGDTPEKLIRNLFNTGERLKRMAQDEKDLAAREIKTYGKIRKARVDAADPDKVLIPIHIRADADVKTGDIYELMDSCKEAGFQTIKARALLGSGEKK